MRDRLLIGTLALGMGVALGAGTSLAGEAKLPSQLIWTAYGTTSSGYAQAVAIGNMLKNKHGTTIAVKPGKNDISRMTPLRDGKADFCACGIASYFGQEGVALFASPKWGPQPIRMVMSSIGAFGIALATAKDANIKTYADLKGKRVAWVRGGDALNVNAGAYLAYGGLTWDDVTKVEFSGYSQSWDGMVNDQVDAAIASTPSPPTKKLAASPRGIHWPTVPHSDSAGWARLLEAAPYFLKHIATVGTEISKDNPWEGASYAYPILVTNASFDADAIYALTKAMDEGYEDYGPKVPGARGWALASQNFQWVLPYHQGAIRYYKDKGVWSDAAQAHNDALIKRQGVIAAAWKSFMAGTVPDEKGAFKAAWMAARGQALEGAGLPTIFN